MSFKRVLTFLAILMLLCGVWGAAMAEGGTDEWWAQEYWDVERLTALGAVAPYYNAAASRYEISTPEELLFLSGEWKTTDTNGDGAADAPRDGVYVLMNDLDMAPLMASIGNAITQASGKKSEDYMPPISANKENKTNPDDGYFMGVFDGQGHAISNLHIVRNGGKYVGMFGYVGYKTAPMHAVIKNLALMDIQTEGVEDCGTLAGGCYADVDNVLVVGSVKGESGVGGLTSSIKSGGGDNVAHVTNCFVLADVLTGGEETGGMTCKIAGYVANCFVAGGLFSDEKIAYGGGLSGVYDAGVGVENNAVFHSGIRAAAGSEKVGALVGSLDGDSGRTLKNNLVWDGMMLSGNPDYSHPEQASETFASYAQLTQKSTYTDVLGWDFDAVWAWVGEAENGYPILKSFTALAEEAGINQRLTDSFQRSEPVLRADNPPLTKADANVENIITATFTPAIHGAETPDEATLWYGTDKDGAAFTESVRMALNESGAYAAAFPEREEGVYYYYIKAAFSGGEKTYPVNISDAIPLELIVPVIDATPLEITLSPGTDATRIGFNFITSLDAERGEIRYRAAGERDYMTLPCTSYVSCVDEGWDEIVSHWADAEGLSPDAAYEYQAVGFAGESAYESPWYSFATMPNDGAINVVFFSDLQATSEAGYEPFRETYESFIVPTLGAPDFLLGTGDNLEDAYKSSEWSNLFTVCGDILATKLNVLLPGNSEHSGDLFYKNYTARTNLPGGMDDEVIGEYTGWMRAGDVCFVFINTEVYTESGTQEREAYYEKQKAWAKEIFENSGCTWRVVATHRGPYTTDHNGLADVPEMIELCRELYVDLFLNGHDHSYIRVTALDGVKMQPGEATTYLTTSSMGLKLDDYAEGLIDDLVAVHVGSSDRVRQKFGNLRVDADGLHVTIYERGEEEDYATYDVIDQIDVAESLSMQAGLVEGPAGEAEDALASDTAQDDPLKKQAVIWPYIVIVLVAAMAVVIWVAARRRKAAGANQAVAPNDSEHKSDE